MDLDFTVRLNITIRHVLNLFLFVLTIFFLILPALQNGYPLTYSDTGTYIYSGYEKFVPIDRPVGYGLFIYFFSQLINSLWTIIILQAVFIFWLTHFFLKL